VHTIVVLDVSGSMGQNVQAIVNFYLPQALTRLGIEKITLITFTDGAQLYNYTVEDLTASKLKSQGGTYIYPALTMLEKVLESSDTCRILTISDGEIGDCQECINFNSLLAGKLSGKQIQSSTIRFFTSRAHPDTRALCSLMQLDNMGSGSVLIDVDSAAEPGLIIDKLAAALDCKGFLSAEVTAGSGHAVLRKAPWSIPTTSLKLQPGANTFWICSSFDGDLSLDGAKLEVTEFRLTINNYIEALGAKVKEFTDQLKILKVVNADVSKTDQMVAYFRDLETYLQLTDPEPNLNANHDLRSRLKFLIHKKSRALSQRLSEIANDDRVARMNSAQTADYLRSAQTSSNAVNLAKIALKNGIDFDIRARTEAQALADNFQEIADIIDTGHEVSFYSQATTLEGLRSVCTLTKSPDFHNNTALDILLLLNIVGVPCQGAIGDFPDPKTYHPSKMFFSTRVSISDLLICSDLAGGNTELELHDPYTRERIHNVVPIYDDDRIQQYLLKYAPTLLEYTASLGMRRMLLEVAHSYKYTVVGGLWYTARAIQDTPTTVIAEALIKLTLTYRTAVQDLFDRVLSLIEPQDPKLSYYIGNNGTTNMIGPLISLCEKGRTQYMPQILRALFSFEFNQVVRKYYRSDSDGHIKRKALLADVLGIDTIRHASALPPMFHAQPCPQHHTGYYCDNTVLKKIVTHAYWVNYLGLLPKLFEIIVSPATDKVMSIIKLCQDPPSQESLLDLSFNITQFKQFCIAQSFLYETRESRIDDEKLCMKIQDCGNYNDMDALIRDYVQKQYHSHYQSELSKQNKREAELLMASMIDELCNCEIDQYCLLLKDGLTRGSVHVQFNDSYSQGVCDFRDRLFNMENQVLQRAEKIRIFLMGSTSSDVLVWNKGNVYKISYDILTEQMNTLGLADLLESILPAYKLKALHIYRGSNAPNRHTHCNPKPSYWAYGFNNLREYFDAISPEEREAYCRLHTNCCGIWDGKPVKWA
jgi:hypothetical protein